MINNDKNSNFDNIFGEQISVPICKIEAKFNKEPERRVHSMACI